MRDRFEPLRQIPLTAVLRASGARPDPYDQAKWHTAQGTLSITGMKFMNWNQNRGGGGAIDLVMHLNHLDFKAAVEWLGQHFPTRPGSLAVLAPHSLTLPPPDPHRLPALERYLVQQRALRLPLIQSLITSGQIYADHRANAVFLLCDQENGAVGAELRGTGAARWRGLAPGSRKDLGYFSLHPSAAPTRTVLCESAIDAISCFLLHPAYLTISTSGARPNPAWLPGLLAQGHPVYCGFDADAIGDDLAQQMMALYPGVQRLRPTQHDWNDVLKSITQIPLFLPAQ
ncbi:MAG: DUF3991 domain-containing protein [Terriglobia bacterium]